MAIETGALFKGFTFGGISSKDFGVYISGDAVFNAPEKDVEMISVPGRNGAFALDHGRWMNIEVTYPAGLFGTTEDDFAEAISNLRNALASKKGYQVLEDDYHPGEFRQAIYRSGLEVTPAQLKAGEFSIVFDCKPQRFLLEGQDPVTIASGGTITNPTLFDAAPLLLVDGYGAIGIGEGGVTVQNVPLGYTKIGNQTINAANLGPDGVQFGTVVALDAAKMNTGNSFTVAADGFFSLYSGGEAQALQVITSAYMNVTSAIIAPATTTQTIRTVSGPAEGFWSMQNMAFVYGTAKTYSVVWEVLGEGHSTADPSIVLEFTAEAWASVSYDGANTVMLTFNLNDRNEYISGTATAEVQDVYGNSTKNATGNPLYIDLDIGEAYKVEDGQTISSNAAVNLGATLPVLPPGETEITFPATIASLQVVPRYWKL